MNEVLQWIAIAIVAATSITPGVTRVVRDFKEEDQDDSQ